MHKPLVFILWGLMAAFGCGLPSIGSAGTFDLTPISDAFVAAGPTGNLSNNNYGGGGALAIAASGLPNGEFQSVIQFDLSSARSSFDAQFGAGQWSIESVSLQLSASPHNNAIYNNVAAGMFGISLMQNNSWVEGTGNASNPAANGITYNSLQNTFINNAVDQPLGTFSFGGQTSGATDYSLNLTTGLTSDILAGGDASLRLLAADTAVSYLFSSRSQAGLQPTLIITAVPEPGSFALFGLALAMVLRSRRVR
jgi:hypothetical protein